MANRTGPTCAALRRIAAWAMACATMCAVAAAMGTGAASVGGPVGLDIVTLAKEALTRGWVAGLAGMVVGGLCGGAYRHSRAAWLIALCATLAVSAGCAASDSLRTKIRLGQQLYDAIVAGDVSRARTALNAGADVNQRDWYSPENWDDYDEDSLLAVAAEKGHIEIVRLMVERGADVNARYRHTPLLSAAMDGRDDVVSYLLDHGADTRSVDPEGSNALSGAVAAGHLATARILRIHGVEPTLLDVAALGEEQAVRAMLRAGADIEAVDQYGRTPLMQAAQWGIGEATTTLLKCGAKTDTRYHARDADDNSEGETALAMAARGGEVGHREVLRALLGGGADPNAAAADGTTPLMAAAAAGNTPAARILLAHGAIASIKDRRGATAYMRAKGEGHEDAARLIASYGGK